MVNFVLILQSRSEPDPLAELIEWRVVTIMTQQHNLACLFVCVCFSFFQITPVITSDALWECCKKGQIKHQAVFSPFSPSDTTSQTWRCTARSWRPAGGRGGRGFRATPPACIKALWLGRRTRTRPGWTCWRKPLIQSATSAGTSGRSTS